MNSHQKNPAFALGVAADKNVRYIQCIVYKLQNTLGIEVNPAKPASILGAAEVNVGNAGFTSLSWMGVGRVGN